MEACPRSGDAFVLRRCQIILASARGEWAPRIARNLGRGDQAVRNAIVAFNQSGLDCLTKGSSIPHTMARPLGANVGPMYPALDTKGVEKPRALLHQSPRTWWSKRCLKTMPTLRRWLLTGSW